MGQAWEGQTYLDLTHDVQDYLDLHAKGRGVTYLHWDKVVGNDWLDASLYTGDGVHIDKEVIRKIKHIFLTIIYNPDSLKDYFPVARILQAGFWKPVLKISVASLPSKN